MLDVARTQAASALTPTGGFLRAGTVGFTHSFSPAIGCPLGSTACGAYCYAPFLQSHAVHGRGAWGSYVLVKENAAEVLRAELERAARRDPNHRHFVQRIRVFSASSTEPLAGPLFDVTRACLRVAAAFPIAAWALQTRSPRIVELEEEIAALSGRVSVSLTIESDDDRALDFGRPRGPSIASRKRALERMGRWGVPIHAAVSPFLPLTDAGAFLSWLDEHADVVTVDTAVDGDGTGEGRRTARTPYAEYEERAGFDWRDTRAARAFYELLRGRIGPRAGWSADGFRRLADPPALPMRPRANPRQSLGGA